MYYKYRKLFSYKQHTSRCCIKNRHKACFLPSSALAATLLKLAHNAHNQQHCKRKKNYDNHPVIEVVALYSRPHSQQSLGARATVVHHCATLNYTAIGIQRWVDNHAVGTLTKEVAQVLWLLVARLHCRLRHILLDLVRCNHAHISRHANIANSTSLSLSMNYSIQYVQLGLHLQVSINVTTITACSSLIIGKSLLEISILNF